MWFLTTGPMAIIPIVPQSFPSERTAGVSSRSTTVQNKSNSLTYTVVASSSVSTSPFPATTIRQTFLRLSRFPIPQSQGSFLLSICVFAPESTTNSRSSHILVRISAPDISVACATATFTYHERQPHIIEMLFQSLLVSSERFCLAPASRRVALPMTVRFLCEAL